MIRLNVFFEVSDPEKINDAIVIGNRLVEASRNDRGCVSYGMFHSTTDQTVFMICETWQDDASLAEHSGSRHFTELVPRLEALTKNGLKLERFER